MGKFAFLFAIILIVGCNPSNDPLNGWGKIEEDREGESLDAKARTAAQRWQFEFDLMKNPTTGAIPEGIFQLEDEMAREAPLLKTKRNGASLVITPRGPNNMGGRTRAIVFDVRDPNVMLSGGVSSGVFRSTNGGSSWVKVSANDEIHSVTALAQDVRAGFGDTWYYGTGESLGNSVSLPGASYRGYGIWKSTDNGETWNALASTQAGSLQSYDNNFDYINRIVVSPFNGYVFAAVGAAIMRSTDGGASWSTLLGDGSNTSSTDIIVLPGGRLYAAIDGGHSSEGVYTSSDHGDNWTKIAGAGTPTGWNLAGQYGRVVLAYAPSNPSIVFALYYNNFNSSCDGIEAPEAELFRYNQFTNTWVDLSANLPDEAGCSNGNDPFAVQGGYDLVVAVKPDDENVVFVGGTNLYRSTDGFTTSSNTTRIGGYSSPAGYVTYANHHPDIHTLVFSPNNRDVLYSGTDGGIHSADITTPSVTWTSLNTDYVTYQYYHVDILPTQGSNVVIGGAQDNGITISSSGTTHESSWGGDGCAVGAISFTDMSNYNMIEATQNGSLYRFYRHGGYGWYIRPNGTNSSIFVTYFHLDQDNTDHLYYVDGSTLYRTRMASTITNTSVTGNSATGWELLSNVGSTVSANIRSIATSRNVNYSGNSYSVSDANRKMYIGTQDGKIYRLDDPAFSTSAPVEITPPTATAWAIVNGLSVNPSDDNEVIAVYSNYGVPSVFHTTNANSATPTWTEIEGSGAVEVSSARSCLIASSSGKKYYFVGTTTGLYCTDALNGNATVWTRVGSNSIGFAVVSSMRYRPSDNVLLIGTHGNGMFTTDLSALLPVELSYFEASKQGRNVLLSWRTASEQNSDYFDIEHSSDGLAFTSVGRRNGSGTSNEPREYTFVHNRPVSGLNYYRLKQVDFNGKFSYSDITSVLMTATPTRQKRLNISPNPFDNELTINWMDDKQRNEVWITISDLSGRNRYELYRGTVNRSITLSTAQLNLSRGMYVLTVQEGKSKPESFKVLKR